MEKGHPKVTFEVAQIVLLPGRGEAFSGPSRRADRSLCARSPEDRRTSCNRRQVGPSSRCCALFIKIDPNQSQNRRKTLKIHRKSTEIAHRRAQRCGGCESPGRPKSSFFSRRAFIFSRRTFKNRPPPLVSKVSIVRNSIAGVKVMSMGVFALHNSSFLMQNSSF